VTVWRFERLGFEAVYIYIMGNEAKDFVLRTAIFCRFLFFVYFGVTMTAITSQVVKNHADGSMTTKKDDL
jgi:K+-transporting ATPase c subunit